MSFSMHAWILLAPAMLTMVGCGASAPPPPPAPPKVNVAHPTIRELVNYDDYNGWIDAVQTVEVRGRVRGHIQKVDFTDGQIVKKDQVLFELDPRPFEANVSRAKDQVRIYEAQLVAARREETRLKDLLAKGGSSQSQVDKSEADALSLEAQVESGKQEIRRQELDLEYSRVAAPIGGRVSRAQLTEGNLVNAGGSDPVLTTIVSVNPMFIYFTVDERAMQRYMKARTPQGEEKVRTGAVKDSQLAFQFGLDTDEGFPHTGILDFVDNQVDRQTGTVLVRGAVANPQGMFVAGSRVKVRVPVSEARKTTLIPDTAVLSDQDRKNVLVVDEKNIVHRRDISPGRLLDDGMRVVLPGENGAGLLPNDWVIVLGIQSARINYPVDPVKPSTPAAESAPAKN